MFSAPTLVQIFDHVSHTFIMNWLKTSEKFTTVTHTRAHEFLESRGNPYDLEINFSRQLYNTARGAVVPSSTAEKLLCFYDYGIEKCIDFMINCLVQKETSLSSTIKKIHMPNFLTHLKNKEKTKTKSV